MVPALLASMIIFPLSDFSVKRSTLSVGASRNSMWRAWPGIRRLARALASCTLSGTETLQAVSIAVSDKLKTSLFKCMLSE